MFSHALEELAPDELSLHANRDAMTSNPKSDFIH